MLIFISDLHLRPGTSSHLPKHEQFVRFWDRIERSPHEGPARLAFVGDLFDLVRSPRWFDGDLRPYHEPSAALEAEVDAQVRATIVEEQPFFDALRSRVEAGELEIHYALGNHDRLLHTAPAARASVRAAFGIDGGSDPFPTELVYPEHRVLAYHGHTVDDDCHDPDGGAPLSDLFASELIARFPPTIRETLGIEDHRLDDIDDVRPIFAVPSWVRSLTDRQQRGIGRDVAKAWRLLVEEFLDHPTVAQWFKDHHKAFKWDLAGKMKLLLALAAKGVRLQDARFTEAYKVLFGLFDTKFAEQAHQELSRRDGLQFVVNGHTHFAGMRPLGLVDGRSGCYFNTGTWRTVHQMGRVGDAEEAFLAYAAMSYLVFFDGADRLGRTFEWWQGVASSEPAC
jgi:UDP-2,3-diacylglucosamine pyrophosphatase LpxH